MNYTSIEQSKKLAEILPLESADMEYMFLKKDGSKVSNVPFVKDGFEEPECCYIFIPCWSLAALLGVLPEYNLQRTDWPDKTEYKIVVSTDEDSYASKNHDNPLDACYELVLKLHELKML